MYMVNGQGVTDESRSEASMSMSQTSSIEKGKLKKEAEENRQKVEVVGSHLGEQRRLLDRIEPSMKWKGQTIYEIKKSAISLKQQYLALGMKDGSVVVWDLELRVQRYILDKHSTAVTGLSFLGDSFVVSGSEDGSVHAHCMQTGRTVMKRTNLFRQTVAYGVVAMDVSSLGLAVSLDSLGNARAYDIFHQ